MKYAPDELCRFISCILSAGLYVLLLTSPFFWWVALVWAVPLWYGMLRWKLFWYHGIIWGLVTVGVHGIGLFKGITSMAVGSSLCVLAVPGTFLIYQAMLSATWFVVINWFLKLFASRTSWGLHLLGIVFITWLYLMFVVRWSLLLYGIPEGGLPEGYALFSPVIPLAEYPALLWFLPTVGESVCVLMVLGFQALLLSAMVHISRHSVGAVLVFSILWFGGAGVQARYQKSDRYDWADQIGVIRSQFFDTGDRQETLDHVADHIADLRERHPHIRCILLPESSLYQTDIFSGGVSEPNGFTGLQKEVCIVAGGFRRSEVGCHNTVWLIVNSQVTGFFDKKNVLLPFTEYIPWWARGSSLEFLYTHSVGELFSGAEERPVWEIIPGVFVVPYICSEFFLAMNPRDSYKNFPVLALCNNAWAPENLRWMMSRIARFRAISWGRAIIYTAHQHVMLITPQGDQFPLNTEERVCGWNG